MNREYSYKSVLGPHIKDFVKEKQAVGYSYQTQAYLMKKFGVFQIELTEYKKGAYNHCPCYNRIDKNIINRR